MNRQNPILRLLAPAKPLVLWTAGVLLVTLCLDIATPLFSQVFVDSIITHKHPEWETPMMILLVVILVISLVNVFFGYHQTGSHYGFRDTDHHYADMCLEMW